MENLIKLKRSEEIKKVDLLAFLAGERCQFTEQEVQLIKSFPNLPQDSLQNGNPQTTEQLYIFLQGLVELFHRTNLETYKSKGDSFTESRHIAKYVSHLLSREKQEYFYILILDNKNRVIRNHRVSQGLLNKSLVHPREVFAPALELRAASIVLIHNHPSGDTSPSVQDRTITKRLCEVGNLTGINVIDHLIIGDETYFSFVDHGIMPFVD
ncbi:MAG: hypothetical protein GY786_16160 [Proteobacteria bacterium]|nr:hypothetical protein [Pseudomonadota bacterium]